MTKELLKLALEALENTTPTGFNMERDKQFFEAITALKKALAQPEQEPVAWIEHYQGSIAYNPYKDAAKRLPDGVRFDLCITPPAAQPAQEKCRVCGEGEATIMVIRECNKCGSEYAGKAEFNLAKAQPAPVQKPVAKHYVDGGHLVYPAAHRTWVGLTPDEYRQLEKETTVCGLHGDYCPTWDLIESVEAKLKEKNA